MTGRRRRSGGNPTAAVPRGERLLRGRRALVPTKQGHGGVLERALAEGCGCDSRTRRHRSARLLLAPLTLQTRAAGRDRSQAHPPSSVALFTAAPPQSSGRVDSTPGQIHNLAAARVEAAGRRRGVAPRWAALRSFGSVRHGCGRARLNSGQLQPRMPSMHLICVLNHPRHSG